MAQLVEQRIRNAWVAGSSPAIGSFHTGVRTYVLTPVVLKTHYFSPCGFSSVGRALASQAEGRGFESRNPLLFYLPRKSHTEFFYPRNIRNFFIHRTHGEHSKFAEECDAVA